MSDLVSLWRWSYFSVVLYRLETHGLLLNDTQELNNTCQASLIIIAFDQCYNVYLCLHEKAEVKWGRLIRPHLDTNDNPLLFLITQLNYRNQSRIINYSVQPLKLWSAKQHTTKHIYLEIWAIKFPQSNIKTKYHLDAALQKISLNWYSSKDCPSDWINKTSITIKFHSYIIYNILQNNKIMIISH